MEIEEGYNIKSSERNGRTFDHSGGHPKDKTEILWV